MPKPKRKICVVTGSRAEYGLLYWLMKEIQDDSDLELQVVATGMHLSNEFGNTFQVIEQDGFEINYKVDMVLSGDSPEAITKSIGVGTIGFADAFSQLSPDIIVLLGDRYELLAASQAALIARIPIAHLHGGEVTEGAFDEAIRHSITKMSHLHFTAAEKYRERVIQLGESPERVFNFGATGFDNISRLDLLSLEELETSIDFKLGAKTVLVTFHSTTLENNTSEEAVNQLLSALAEFQNLHIIFTRTNSDTDGRIINQQIEKFVEENPDTSRVFTSLGQLRYLSAVKHVDALVGNTSSGLIEAPFLKTATVNIGDRQSGRLRADSVVDCAPDSKSIVSAVEKVLSPEFQSMLSAVESPYGKGEVAPNVKKVLKDFSLENLVIKKFHDIGVGSV